MAYTVNHIADWFLSKLNTDAGDTISPLKLQKLVYYAQAWHLTVFSTPLFEEDVQAWAHGPVVPSLYHRFKNTFRDHSIEINEIGLETVKFPIETEGLLNEVYSLYGEHSAGYLENLTHSETPWIEARIGIPVYQRSEAVITHASMIKYYSSLNNGGQA